MPLDPYIVRWQAAHPWTRKPLDHNAHVRTAARAQQWAHVADYARAIIRQREEHKARNPISRGWWRHYERFLGDRDYYMDRDWRIIRDAADGTPISELAAREQLSRSRVRQIIKRYYRRGYFAAGPSLYESTRATRKANTA